MVSEVGIPLRSGGIPRSRSVSWGKRGPSGKQKIPKKTGSPREVGSCPRRAEAPQKSGGYMREGGSPRLKKESVGSLTEVRSLREGESLGEAEVPYRSRGFLHRSEPRRQEGTHWRRSPRRSGSPREARGTGSRGPATSGAGPSLTEVARRPQRQLLGPGRPRVAGSDPVRSGPAAAAPSGGSAVAAATGRRTEDRPTARATRGALGRRGCACARWGADPGREEPPRRARSLGSVSPLSLTLKLPASQPGFPGC